jgi:uncharacterized protein (TIGR03437 family)
MYRLAKFRLFLLAASIGLSAGLAQSGDSSYLSRLPSGDRWIAHLTTDLLPFWTMPSAVGNPTCAFPSTRCDDGSLLNFKNPCPPIAGNAYLLTPARYLVALSRQTYGYGVAYHLTGDPRYLQYMKAGIDYLRQYTIDRQGGGMFTSLDLNSGDWGPQREFRNPQELGYGLLGLALYYYLTRDDQVLPDILAIKQYIIGSYYNPSLGAMQWMLQNNGDQRFDQKQLVADLDQMNTYLVLLAPILDEPYRTQWKQTLALLTRSMLGVYYSPGDNLFFTSANTPQDTDLSATGVDFGHSSKALWMIRWTGLILGDAGLVSFAESAGRKLFDRAWLPEDGSWAKGVLKGGEIDENKNWWIFAELDQYSATLALTDVTQGRHLPDSADYWFKYFVDHQFGEVWNGVNYGSNTPQRDFPKAWQWKSAYHDFEHALVGYIVAQYLNGQPARLHYAFQKQVDPALIHPYYFPGTVQSVETSSDVAGNQYQAVTFAGTSPPPAKVLAAVSAASFLPGTLAAGSIASAFAAHLSTDTQAALSGPLPTTLAGTAFVIKDASGASLSAPLFYAAPGQVDFLVPSGTAAGGATITVTAMDGTVTSGDTQIALVSPGIFQLNLSTNLAAANVVRVKPDQSQTIEAVYVVSPANDVRAMPIDLGPPTDQLYLVLYGTGIRNGKVVAVTIGGQDVPVLYSGAQPQLAGVDQVNVGPVPRSLGGRGRANIIMTTDGQTANPVQVVIK